MPSSRTSEEYEDDELDGGYTSHSHRYILLTFVFLAPATVRAPVRPCFVCFICALVHHVRCSSVECSDVHESLLQSVYTMLDLYHHGLSEIARISEAWLNQKQRRHEGKKVVHSIMLPLFTLQLHPGYFALTVGGTTRSFHLCTAALQSLCSAEHKHEMCFVSQHPQTLPTRTFKSHSFASCTVVHVAFQ